MEVTQEVIISLLVEEGGKVKNSDLTVKFKGSLNCADPAEKKQKRDLFKRFVNNVAVVKEIDDVKYVVLKKKYHHLLKENRTVKHQEDNSETESTQRPGDPPRREDAETCADNGGESSVSDNAQEQTTTSGVSEGNSVINEPHSPTELQSAMELVLQRCNFVDFKPKRSLNFDIVQSSDTNLGNSSGQAAYVKTNTTIVYNKPYALPLRMPPSTTVVVCKLKGDSDDPPEKPDPDPETLGYFRNNKRPSVESVSLNSPQPGSAVKSTKPPEEPKEPRFTSAVPLEQSEHEWLVKSAAGQWSQVYGLLLSDNQLAEKRDFMSGFTALHWAAKCGNREMVTKIIEISRLGGQDIDVNAKTYGGYTPLHIAALHNQELILTTLVEEYGADTSIRDNCGKRAYHYLHKGVSEGVRDLLGEPKTQQAQDSSQQEREELDLFPDLSKGLHTISRLFQPHMTGHKKKHKQRPGFYSVNEETREEREESGSKHRVVSDVFM
ncbi:ankyrin repeat domain-containing protein SOWAHA [Polymixia lowei]